MTWVDAAKLAFELPHIALSTSYGTPALKVNGKLLTRLRTEDDSLVLLGVPFAEREMLIEADPGTFHTTPHYENYPTVLVRLGAVEPSTVRAFLERRWRSIAPKRAVKLLDAEERADPRTADDP